MGIPYPMPLILAVGLMGLIVTNALVVCSGAQSLLGSVPAFRGEI
jgi:hypothetical protein